MGFIDWVTVFDQERIAQLFKPRYIGVRFRPHGEVESQKARRKVHYQTRPTRCIDVVATLSLLVSLHKSHLKYQSFFVRRLMLITNSSMMHVDTRFTFGVHSMSAIGNDYSITKSVKVTARSWDWFAGLYVGFAA